MLQDCSSTNLYSRERSPPPHYYFHLHSKSLILSCLCLLFHTTLIYLIVSFSISSLLTLYPFISSYSSLPSFRYPTAPKDLGVIFDRVLALRQHVSYTLKTCRFHLRIISRIRKYIPQDTIVVLVKSLVMSRLDYSNGLFYGLPKCTVSGLQAVQYSAARIVTQERLRDHDSMSRALIWLHWLPVDKRIEYKLLLYTYKALHDLAPGYLCELVNPYVPRRVLRSAELNLLTVPSGKPGKYGSRNFARASANLWNSLRGERAAWLKNSPTLESFKRNLKTFLFWERFSS